MQHREQWIWLSKARYPMAQETIPAALDSDPAEGNYTVAEFRRSYTFSRKVLRAELRFSGDTAVQLWCGGSLIGTGPASVGGDFIGNGTVRENFYAFETVTEPCSDRLDFYARVRMRPVQICEYSKGRGGFLLSAVLTMEDGSRETVCTDESWFARKDTACLGDGKYDGTLPPDDWGMAECVENIWHAETAPIPLREERELLCENSRITLEPGEEKTVQLVFDRIWAGFLRVEAKTRGRVDVRVGCRELDEAPRDTHLAFLRDGSFRGFTLHSAGNMEVQAKNSGSAPAEITVSLLETHYPVTQEAVTVTSDKDLNQVLDTCRHTLKICRQTHHLDSPRHCEPMACTGDYYIESLMTMFSFGDLRLAEFDLLRTAVMLEREKGRMFHTTYSLIWVRMLWDMYMAAGNRALLTGCEKALRLLLARFETYVGENGLIETPPDYMFVDWIYIDGISMHHPPKALGQTCLNLFYFAALAAAEKIFGELACPAEADRCAEKREALGKAVDLHLYDRERGVYFMGLNTPTEETLLGEWMPRNTGKRYYMKHANILAAWAGVCGGEEARELLRKVLAEEIEGDVQPYFLHFLLEAVCSLGLREECLLPVLERWKAPVAACTKGLVEGFVKPEPTYSFDHSHAWGGTPLYALPKALMGLEITEPGMKAITLSPSLLGLSHARAELLTPYGKVVCAMERGKAPKITAPAEICVTVI